MENKSETIRELQQRILMLEKENNELKNNTSLDGFSVIDVLSINNTTSQKHEARHDMLESDIAFNEQRYAKYCLKRLDDSIKECENEIKLTNVQHDYKLISSSNELKKGFEFQLKRENDKLYVIDAQIKDINKYFSTAPSGNTVLTHTVVNENAYDQLIYKREMINHSINTIRIKISNLNDDILVTNNSDDRYCHGGLGCGQFNILQTGNNNINRYENRIESLLKEKQCIINELKSNKLINRVVAEIEQIHIDNAKQEEKILQCYVCSRLHPYADNKDYAKLNNMLKETFPVYTEQILQYLHFVPKQWFKDKFLIRKTFYENTCFMSDYEVYVFLRDEPCGGFALRTCHTFQQYKYPFDANGYISEKITMVGEDSIIRKTVGVYRGWCFVMGGRYAKFIRIIDEFKTNVSY